MTVDEAIRLLDPKTTEQAFEEIKYYNGFNGKTAALEAFEDACILAAEALRVQRNSGWISVKDRLPEETAKPNAQIVTVLICTKSKRVSIASRCYYEYEEHNNGNIHQVFPAHWEWSKWKGNSVTHWMPLPEPQKEDT